ncbi:MAG: hypothetical protein LC732_12520, partial [Acidobacteria bacterium]|nr:hypothetical protein [Acidobacteriota bacterium]
MKKRKQTIARTLTGPLAILMTTALMACGERAPETNPPAVNQAGAMTPLSSERIAELAERIP